MNYSLERDNININFSFVSVTVGLYENSDNNKSIVEVCIPESLEREPLKENKISWVDIVKGKNYEN